jgi:hypothetical protein
MEIVSGLECHNHEVNILYSSHSGSYKAHISEGGGSGTCLSWVILDLLWACELPDEAIETVSVEFIVCYR